MQQLECRFVVFNLQVFLELDRADPRCMRTQEVGSPEPRLQTLLCAVHDRTSGEAGQMVIRALDDLQPLLFMVLRRPTGSADEPVGVTHGKQVLLAGSFIREHGLEGEDAFGEGEFIGGHAILAMNAGIVTGTVTELPS